MSLVDQPAASPQSSAPDTTHLTGHAPAGQAWRLLAGVLPGLALSLLAAWLAIEIAVRAGFSATLVAIVLGVLFATTSARAPRLLATLEPGLGFTARQVLRLGVVLLGLRLVPSDVQDLGWRVLIGILLVVAITFLATMGLGRLLGVDRDLTLLIAAGFSICGAAAAAGMSGVLRRKSPEKTATAVGLVVIFGSAMIVALPALARALSLSQHTAGLWIGASVHEVAQVVASASLVGSAALAIGIVVKLTRVLVLAPMLTLVAVGERRNSAAEPDATTRPPLVPIFVLAFAVVVALRGWNLVPDSVLAVAGTLQNWSLTAAMFALGTGVRPRALVRGGWRPVALALGATVVVTTVGGAMAWLAN